MEEDMIELNTIFEDIKKKGWIKSKRNGTTGIGYTFESLIGKKEDSNPYPDYKSIEIKTIRDNSKRNIHLFSINPDGTCENPIKEILDTIGYYNEHNNELRCWIDLKINSFKKLGLYKSAKLKINYVHQRIELIVKTSNNKKIDLNVSWSFDKIKERLNNKLRYLAIIKADSKIINGLEYFNYKQINYYIIKDFNTFIELIEKEVIILSLKVQKRNGKYGGHGLDFTIQNEKICMLFNKIK